MHLYMYTHGLLLTTPVYAKMVGNRYAVFVFISMFQNGWSTINKIENVDGKGVHRDSKWP